MADSSITKKALAGSLKELMLQKPFSKITVGEICEKCYMNRKSFYYHFQDKFDLIDWIYSSEIYSAIQGKEYADRWDFLLDICNVLWQNKRFYRQAFEISGQNSLKESMKRFFLPQIRAVLGQNDIRLENDNFCLEFFSDSLICSIERWICQKESTEPEIFIENLKQCITVVMNIN